MLVAIQCYAELAECGMFMREWIKRQAGILQGKELTGVVRVYVGGWGIFFSEVRERESKRDLLELIFRTMQNVQRTKSLKSVSL